MAQPKEILQTILTRVKAFLFSKDALAFCFFCLFSAGVWFVHGLMKAADQPTTIVEVQREPEVRYTEKTFVIPIKPKGISKSVEMVLFPEVVTVTARVSEAHYQQLTADDFRAICTYKSDKDNLPIEVSCSSPHVTGFRISPQTAEYVINRK